jgi:transcriptional regulator, RpiR family
MNKTLLKIKNEYDALGKAEKKIADVLQNNDKSVPSMFIGDFAKLCDCSVATVTRFSKKLGFNGFPQLKIALAREKDFSPVGENITTEDTAAEVFAKICNDIYSSLERTKKSINIDELQKCCETIISADKIFIFGLGNSASVAQDAAHKLFRLGKDSTAYTDNHMQAIAATHTGKSTLVIGVSHSGKSKDIVDALKLSRENGATTVAITSLGNHPLKKVSDIVLNTVSEETNYRILGLSSRIAQLAIIDAIYSYLVCHLPGAIEYINKTESALCSKKY